MEKPRRALAIIGMLVALSSPAGADVIGGIKALAERGDPVSQYYLGNMYTSGHGVAQDNVLAYMWHRLAAAQGHTGARGYLAILAEKMTPEEIDEAERLARDWELSK